MCDKNIFLYSNKKTVVQFCVNYGADLDFKDIAGYTALMRGMVLSHICLFQSYDEP